MNKNSLKLYAITDRSWLKEGESLDQAVEKAILGGATIVQLREKKLKGQDLMDLALLVHAVCKKYQVPLIINDDVALAKEIDAEGVHVGQSDMAVKEARALLGSDKLVGATAKTVEQALRAQAEGADYLGSGAVFGTTTKLDAKPMTRELLEEIVRSVEIPVVAIGGIDESNVAQLKGTGIAGVAVVSGIFAKKNVRRAAEDLNGILYGKSIIQCITNSVTMNQVANTVLALGASPIMAHHRDEVEEVQDFASGLLVNLGATDDYEAMEKAYARAIALGHPIVIDPVGVGSISFRRDFLKKLLAIGSPSCIRGNFGEIKAILEDTTTMRGIDFEETALEEEPEAQKNGIEAQAVKNLAKNLSCIVVATGEVDYISDGESLVVLHTGSPMQKRVTGSGCMLSAAICAKLCVRENLGQVAGTCALLGDCAAQAAEETEGSMSFLQRWMDLL